MPKLKYLAWAENRGESGSNRSANGSSNDSSTSRGVKELSALRGELFQSNSIKSRYVPHSPMQCPYIVFTLGDGHLSNGFSQLHRKSGPPVVIRWPVTVENERRGLVAAALAAAVTDVIHQRDQGQEHGDNDASDDHRQKHDHDRLQQ